MERKLRFLEKEIKKDDIPMMEGPECPEAPQPREMIDLEATFEKLEHETQEVCTYHILSCLRLQDCPRHSKHNINTHLHFR